ncbi:MAG TPA: hypothetical protein VFW85_11185 [Gaiellaceae bacterium]|nr:hypothetical protein [Gaiellaceae bacterium]
MKTWGLVVAVGAVLVLGVPMLASADSSPYGDSDSFYTWPGAVLLHVERNPSPSGYVQSAPYYLDCPNACTRPFDPGQQVTLWAHPSDGPSFTGWSGDLCAGQGNPCTATITQDSIVTANFAGTVVTPRYTLTLTDAGALTLVTVIPPDSPGVPSCFNVFSSTVCSYHYRQGAQVELTASPAFGSPSWGGACHGPYTDPCVITMDRDRSVSIS